MRSIVSLATGSAVKCRTMRRLRTTSLNSMLPYSLKASIELRNQLSTLLDHLVFVGHLVLDGRRNGSIVRHYQPVTDDRSLVGEQNRFYVRGQGKLRDNLIKLIGQAEHAIRLRLVAHEQEDGIALQ